MKMKRLISLTILSFIGCAQLMNGQEQPVITKKDGTFYTTCSGAVENWNSCYSKASRTCAKGYSILEKTENGNGGFRTLTFKCN